MSQTLPIPMPTLEQVSPENALIFKEVRLRALQDTPTAFGSTYAKESQLTDDDWMKRAAQWSSGQSVGYLALDNGLFCGIVAVFFNEEDLRRAHLVSMWVHPSRRRAGFGGLLIDAIRVWARNHGAREVQLMVTSNNHGAIAFYERNGFTKTGVTEPYPNDPALFEHEMLHAIGPLG